MADKKTRIIIIVLIGIIAFQLGYILYQGFNSKIIMNTLGVRLMFGEFEKIELWMQSEIYEQKETSIQLRQLNSNIETLMEQKGGDNE